MERRWAGSTTLREGRHTGPRATCERRESEGIKSGSEVLRADAALFRHCPSEHPGIQLIVHWRCVNPSRGRSVRPPPETPIYHGVEREPRTRVPALPQLPAVRPDCAARLTWPRRGDRETRTRVPAASHSGDGNGLIDCLRVHEEIGP